MAKSKTSHSPTSSEIDKKWTKDLTAAGWTAIPNVLFERQSALGLDALDVCIVLHLSGYWWKADSDPYPSKATLAKAIGCSPRTVQRRIAAMEKAGFIKRTVKTSRHGGHQSNFYSLEGLIEAAKPYAKEHVAIRKQRQAEREARAGRKKAGLTLVKS